VQIQQYFCSVKFFLRIIDVLLYTSLFTACCATGLCMATEKLINGAAPSLYSHLHPLVLGSTLLVYNAPRIFRKQATQKIQPLRVWYYFFFFAGFAMVIPGLYSLSWQIMIGCLVLGMFTFSYSLPLLPFKNKKRLREFGWLKISVLAGVWTIATSILPIVYHQKLVADFPFEILLRLVFIFTLCIVFDIRDMSTDMEQKIHTLPHKIGLHNSYLLMNITLALFVVLSGLQYVRYMHTFRLAGALITAMATWLVIAYLRRHPSDRAYLLLADGVMLLYAVLVLSQ
jgi:4-hydroxybenzoate polyprenyltransferase